SAAINSADIHKFFLKPWENEYLVVQMLEALQVHQTLREKAHFEQLSITDPVTGLTNHRYFQDQLRADLDKAAKENLPLALIIFDVDHFKAFNDRFGHPLGDRLLARVARTLADLAGSQGIVSRYGGEEFTLILPGCSESKAKLFADNIRRHFERTPFTGLMPNATPAYITVSAGVCCYPAHGATANELIESADRALYQAKRQGRNQVGLAKRM
ncbi:MAG: diguanylate cyclase, partial [Bdellovibrionales bacterium]